MVEHFPKILASGEKPPPNHRRLINVDTEYLNCPGTLIYNLSVTVGKVSYKTFSEMK